MEHQPIIPSSSSTPPSIKKKYRFAPKYVASNIRMPMVERLMRSVLSILQEPNMLLTFKFVAGKIDIFYFTKYKWYCR